MIVSFLRVGYRGFRFGAVEYVRERYYGGDGGRGLIVFGD